MSVKINFLGWENGESMQDRALTDSILHNYLSRRKQLTKKIKQQGEDKRGGEIKPNREKKRKK